MIGSGCFTLVRVNLWQRLGQSTRGKVGFVVSGYWPESWEKHVYSEMVVVNEGL